MTQDNDTVLQNPSQKSNFSWSCCFLWTIIGCGIGGIIYLALYITSANNKRNCQNSDTNKLMLDNDPSRVTASKQHAKDKLTLKRQYSGDTNESMHVHGSSSVKTYQQDSTALKQENLQLALDSKRKNLSLVENGAYIPYTNSFILIQQKNAARALGFTHNISVVAYNSQQYYVKESNKHYLLNVDSQQYYPKSDATNELLTSTILPQLVAAMSKFHKGLPLKVAEIKILYDLKADNKISKFILSKSLKDTIKIGDKSDDWKIKQESLFKDYLDQFIMALMYGCIFGNIDIKPDNIIILDKEKQIGLIDASNSYFPLQDMLFSDGFKLMLSNNILSNNTIGCIGEIGESLNSKGRIREALTNFRNNKPHLKTIINDLDLSQVFALQQLKETKASKRTIEEKQAAIKQRLLDNLEVLTSDFFKDFIQFQGWKMIKKTEGYQREHSMTGYPESKVSMDIIMKYSSQTHDFKKYIENICTKCYKKEINFTNMVAKQKSCNQNNYLQH